MARTNIEETTFSKLSKFASRLGWSEREALGLLVIMWHDSQQEQTVICSQDEIYDHCRLYSESEEEKQRILDALIKSKFVSEESPGQFFIRGNKAHIETLKAYKERTKKARLKRLAKINGKSDNSVNSTVDSVDDNTVNRENEKSSVDSVVNSNVDENADSAVYKTEDSSLDRTVHKQQSNAKQSNAKQSNSIYISKADLSKKITFPEKLVEVWNAECGDLQTVDESLLDQAVGFKESIQELEQINQEIGYWESVIKKIAESNFCNGGGKDGWRATFSWLLKPETHLKVLSGVYDSGKKTQTKNHIAIVEQELKDYA